jgi:hypothetical protein
MHSTLLLAIKLFYFKYETITLSGAAFQRTSPHKKTRALTPQLHILTE